MPPTPYDRDTLLRVLIAHQRTSDSGCLCRRLQLGFSHAEHIADIYEAEVR